MSAVAHHDMYIAAWKVEGSTLRYVLRRSSRDNNWAHVVIGSVLGLELGKDTIRFRVEGDGRKQASI